MADDLKVPKQTMENYRQNAPKRVIDSFDSISDEQVMLAMTAGVNERVPPIVRPF